MKQMRMTARVFAVFVAALLTIGFAMPAFAVTANQKGSIELGNIEQGAQINAYKIINVNWNDGANAPDTPQYSWDSAVASWLEAQTDKGYDAYAEADGSVTEAYGEVQSDAAFFSDLAAAIKSGTVQISAAQTTTATDGATVLNDLSMGSYLVLVNNSTNYVYQPIAANLVPQNVNGQWVLQNATVQIDAKRQKMSIDKTVEGSSSTGAQIGDTVNFIVEATVPHYPASATNTKFVVSDTFSKGLTLNADSIRVFGVNGDQETELAAGTNYVLTTQNAHDLSGNEVTFSVDFSVHYDTVSSYDQVRIKYSAVLNENAVVGGAGNKNDAKLEWSNDPFGQDDSIDTDAPDVTPTVYTYGLRVEKVDKGDHDILLPGAVFTVQSNGNPVSLIAIEEAAGHYRVAKTGEDGVEEVKVGADGAAKGKLQIDGLGEGELVLTETHAPDGYALPHDPFKLSITDADQGKLDGIVAESKGDPKDGYADATIENSKGFQLPTTGGTGTVALTAVGVLVMAGAGWYLVRSRKQQ